MITEIRLALTEYSNVDYLKVTSENLDVLRSTGLETYLASIRAKDASDYRFKTCARIVPEAAACNAK